MEITNFQFEILEDIAFGKPLKVVLDKLVTLIEARLPESRGSILLLDPSTGELRLGAAPNLPDEYNQAINGTVIGPNAGACGAAAYLREPVFIDDIRTSERWKGYQDLAATHGLVACWSTPIISRRTHLKSESPGVLGTFAIYPPTVGMPSEEFVTLMKHAQHLACLALEADIVKKTEAKLARQSELLLKAESVVGLGCFEWNVSSNRLSWSDQLYRIFGLEPSGSDITFEFFLSKIHPDDREQVLSTLEEALRTRTSYRHEERIVRPNGEIRVLESFGEVQCDSDGEPIHVVGGCLDVTERRELERQLFQSQKMDAIKRLAGGIAHDFNNLLTIVNGHAADLIAQEMRDASASDALSEILEAGQRAAKLTSRLLDFSETRKLTATVFELKSVVRDTLRLARRSLPQSVQVTKRYTDEPCHIRANQSEIEQLVFNLLLNAGDSMSEEGLLTIEINAPVEVPLGHPQLQPGTYVELVIEDNGTGIEEEFLRRIFEPFSTSKHVGEGRGMGLAVVHGTVTRWDGHIEFISSDGAGTIVKILLPRVSSSAIEGPVPPSESVEGNATILVVDDEDGVRRLVAKILDRAGFVVLQAKNGGEALELAKDTDFDLLVTDIVIPGMRGDRLARAVRTANPQIPVLLMSGYSQNGFDIKDHEDRITRFVPKPFCSQSFMSAIKELLDSNLDQVTNPPVFD